MKKPYNVCNAQTGEAVGYLTEYEYYLLTVRKDIVIDYYNFKYKNVEIKNNETIIFAKINNLLINIEMPYYLNGYNYVREAVLIVILLDIKPYMCRKVYNDVSEKFNTEPKTVEKAIKRVIKRTWCKYKNKRNIKFLGYAPFLKREPSNSEFIFFVSDLVKGI